MLVLILQYLLVRVAIGHIIKTSVKVFIIIQECKDGQRFKKLNSTCGAMLICNCHSAEVGVGKLLLLLRLGVYLTGCSVFSHFQPVCLFIFFFLWLFIKESVVKPSCKRYIWNLLTDCDVNLFNIKNLWI